MKKAIINVRISKKKAKERLEAGFALYYKNQAGQWISTKGKSTDIILSTVDRLYERVFRSDYERRRSFPFRSIKNTKL